jgi:23S rRNA (cytosine1962-C5)-methyltransferase
VIIDRYADTAVLKLYTAAWFPHLRALVTAIDTVGHPARLVLRWARSLGEGPHFGISEGDALLGTAPTDAVMFRENGLWFEADVIRGQKTGHFLDQRDNRALVMRHCQGASVLDVFASTGGFSVYAAAGGATNVTSVDSSTPTLAAASRNMRHNGGLPGVQRCRYESIVDDAYAAMERLARQQRSFDVVVVDPPSFAHRQSDIDMALRAYARLTALAVRLVRPGGLLFQASCSSRVSADAFRATVRAAAQREGFDLVRMRSTGHGVDHPVTFTEGEYLKALVATVQRLPQSAM